MSEDKGKQWTPAGLVDNEDEEDTDSADDDRGL